MPRRKVLYATLPRMGAEMNLQTEAQYRQELATCWQMIEQDRAEIKSLRQQLAAEIMRLEIALRIKTEEHQCCAEDLISLSKSEQDGWKEAAIAWSVCASIHENWAKGKDALYSTRHADFEKRADDARRKLPPNA